MMGKKECTPCFFHVDPFICAIIISANFHYVKIIGTPLGMISGSVGNASENHLIDGLRGMTCSIHVRAIDPLSFYDLITFLLRTYVFSI